MEPVSIAISGELDESVTAYFRELLADRTRSEDDDAISILAREVEHGERIAGRFEDRLITVVVVTMPTPCPTRGEPRLLFPEVRALAADTGRKKLGWNVPVIDVFFGKSPKMPELAGADAVEGVYFTTIFRDFHPSAEQIQEAKAILAKYYPEITPDDIHLWGFKGAQVFTEAMRRMSRDNLTRDRLVETLEGIDGWKGSVVPEIPIGEGNAPAHFLVKDMSYVVYKDSSFQDFAPPWQQQDIGSGGGCKFAAVFPSSPGCRMASTSRRRLFDSAADQSAHRVNPPVEITSEAGVGGSRGPGYSTASVPSSTVTCDDSVPPFACASAISAFST